MLAFSGCLALPSRPCSGSRHKDFGKGVFWPVQCERATSSRGPLQQPLVWSYDAATVSRAVRGHDPHRVGGEELAKDMGCFAVECREQVDYSLFGLKGAPMSS